MTATGELRMDFMGLIDLLGQAPEHPAIVAHLKEANITKQPRPPADELAAFVQFEDQGYEMSFELKPDGVQVYLAGLTAYPKGDATHKPFAGKLPRDIQGSDTPESLASRLGTPVMRNTRANVDMWKLGNWNLVVGYEKKSAQVNLVQVNFPDK
jgi:hypothetical protein